ncbi:MAG TPA: hypothetical protein ENJ12_12200 [Thiolapillus brandeum]|uniref:Uncharacterized protein n=1 Tax=Thiolapillus brandeum TaxID=1076588 RepID=A0A831WCH3_9GAMM|nr:hypothetical protein [Thiolapillus brandeum]
MKLTEEEQSLLNDPVWKKQRQQFWSKVAYPRLRSIWGTGYDEDLRVQTRAFYAALKQVFMTGRIGPQGPDTYENADEHRVWKLLPSRYDGLLFCYHPIQNERFWDYYFGELLPSWGVDIGEWEIAGKRETIVLFQYVSLRLGDGRADLLQQDYGWTPEAEAAWFRYVFGDRYEPRIRIAGRSLPNPYNPWVMYDDLLLIWWHTLTGLWPSPNRFLDMYDYWKTLLPRLEEGLEALPYNMSGGIYDLCPPDEYLSASGILNDLLWTLAHYERAIEGVQAEYIIYWDASQKSGDEAGTCGVPLTGPDHPGAEEIMAQPGLAGFRQRFVADLESGALPEGMCHLWRRIRDDRENHYIKADYKKNLRDAARILKRQQAPRPEEVLPWSKDEIKGLLAEVEPLTQEALARKLTDLRGPVKTHKALARRLQKLEKHSLFRGDEAGDIAASVMQDAPYARLAFVMPNRLLYLESEPFEEHDLKAYYRDAWKQVAAMVRDDLGRVSISARDSGGELPDRCAITVKAGDWKQQYEYHRQGASLDEDLLPHLQDFARQHKLPLDFTIQRPDEMGIYVFYLPGDMLPQPVS